MDAQTEVYVTKNAQTKVYATKKLMRVWRSSSPYSLNTGFKKHFDFLSDE